MCEQCARLSLTLRRAIQRVFAGTTSQYFVPVLCVQLVGQHRIAIKKKRELTQRIANWTYILKRVLIPSHPWKAWSMLDALRFVAFFVQENRKSSRSLSERNRSRFEFRNALFSQHIIRLTFDRVTWTAHLVIGVLAPILAALVDTSDHSDLDPMTKRNNNKKDPAPAATALSTTPPASTGFRVTRHTVCHVCERPGESCSRLNCILKR
jgi:hypothetical protein